MRVLSAKFWTLLLKQILYKIFSLLGSISLFFQILQFETKYSIATKLKEFYSFLAYYLSND